MPILPTSRKDMIVFMKKKKEFVTYEEKYLVSELLQTRKTFKISPKSFYQVNSVQKRYKFLLERAKEANIAVFCEIAPNEF